MRATSGAPSVGTCLLLLFGVKSALRVVGFAVTRRWLERTSHRSRHASPLDSQLLAAIANRVATAAALYPGRALCLERSLSLHWLLRRRGVDSRFRLGVRHFPFLAHAWVEHSGHPIEEGGEILRNFTVVDEQST